MHMCKQCVYFHEQSLWWLNFKIVISLYYCVLHIYAEQFTHCDSQWRDWLYRVWTFTNSLSNVYLSFKKSFHLKYEWKVNFGVLRNDIYLWIMFPLELTIIRRNWLNDNIDKTIIFNKSMNENMKEKDFIL